MKIFSKIAIILLVLLIGFTAHSIYLKEREVMEGVSHRYSEFANEAEKYNPKNIGTALTNATDSVDATVGKYFSNELKKGHEKDIQENKKNGLIQ